MSVALNLVLIAALAGRAKPSIATMWALARCETKLKAYAEIDALAQELERVAARREAIP